MSVNPINNPAPITVEEAQKLLEEYQVAFTEMRQADRYDEWIEPQDKARKEILEGQMKSAYAILDQYVKTGEWLAEPGTAGVPAPTAQNPEAWNNELRNMQPGWNGDMQIRTDVKPPGYNNANFIHQLFPGDANIEYAGAVYLQDDGDPSRPLQVALQASETSLKIEGFNKGNDIIYVETYIDPSTKATKKRFWIGVDHATNVRANIMVDAHNLKSGRLTGIVMDFSRVYRLTDGPLDLLDQKNQRNGLILIGSDLNDKIIGSQWGDVISGLKGNDVLQGEAGDDTIDGDDGFLTRLAATESTRTGKEITVDWIRQQLGLRTDLIDGDDKLHGGVGFDTLDGNGGVNTGSDTDTIDEVSKRNLSGGFFQSKPAELSNPEHSLITESAGFAYSGKISAGVYEIKEVVPKPAGVEHRKLTLAMPPGFDMAFATKEGNDLIITYVKHGTAGTGQMKVIVRGAMRGRTASLGDPLIFKIKGNSANNIIDFSRVNFQNNIFKFEADAQDMVLQPRTVFTEHGTTVDQLLDPANRLADQVAGSISNIIPEQDGVHAEPQSGEILVQRQKTAKETTDGALWNHDLELTINAAGYSQAYILRDGADLQVILTKPSLTKNDPPQTMVVRIQNYAQFARGKGPEDLSWLKIQSIPNTPEVKPGETANPQYEPSPTITPIILESSI